MVENLPFQTLQHDGLTIEGYSRAAVQSYWRIPELKLGFDLGGSPWDFMNVPTIFITHAHLDHMAALPVYVARRRMMKMEPPTIYLPEENVEWADRLLKVWQRLDRGRMVCQLVGVKPGQEIELSRDHVVTTFETRHTVPSVGYLVWQRRKKLKLQYQSMSGNEIRDLRKSGVDVTHEVRTPLVCYTGDTAPPGLDNYPALYEAKILITEMTFFRPDHRKEKIYKFGHTHLDDIIERADRFKNELIIIMHFSTRYATNQIERAVMKRLPAQLRDRVKLWF
ncbi:MBL fold metallo-hydrolase [Schlesneria paludicola]|uniref:MBL fold metallo-hydrolase n=1 Tax=Schlesneria paludicola TaxID=360056 RepID=UPI00029A87BF|nr:MBL fold metallo-hydrolase [Schlesneria paludicola]